MSARARVAIPLGLLALVVAVAAVVWFTRRRDGEAQEPADLHTPVALGVLDRASGWLDGARWSSDSLAGKPVLLVVWSDTDPLSLGMLPEAEAWQRAYGRFGLRVLGVHMPQYSFAADSAVPGRALRRIGVHLPVALDGGLEISTQLGAGAATLPLWVLVDPHGGLEYRAEGARAASVKAAIEALLRREHPESGIVPPTAVAESDARTVRRVFCGTSRVGSGPLTHAVPGHTETYTAEFRYQEEGEAYAPYPVGRWTPTAEGLTAARGGAADFVSIRYDGGAVQAVMGAGDAREPIKVWVLSDDAWVPEAQRGQDIQADARGATYVAVSETRLYSIARGGGRHVLKLSPEAPGVTIHELAFVQE